MSGLEIAITLAIVGAAFYFMARRTIRKYRGTGGGCGSGGGGKTKKVSLTVGGQPMRRR